MIRKINSDYTFKHRHMSDVIRLQKVLLQNEYEADLPIVAQIWEDYSDDFSAGWLGMGDDDDELFACIKDRVERLYKKYNVL